MAGGSRSPHLYQNSDFLMADFGCATQKNGGVQLLHIGHNSYPKKYRDQNTSATINARTILEVRASITMASTAACGPPTPNLKSYYIYSSDVFCFLLFCFCPNAANIDILPSGVPDCFSI
jgi:hypothetical protein